jgi:hypothetical protein
VHPLLDPFRNLKRSMLRPTAIAITFLILSLPGTEALWKARDLPHLGQSYDDGIYWVTTKALAAGSCYGQMFLRGEPYFVRYPPLYPIHLSLAWRVQPAFPLNISWAVLLQAMLLPLQVALLLMLLREMGLSWRRRVLIAALRVTSGIFLLLTCSQKSKMLFDCLLFGAILLAQRSAEAGRGEWVGVMGAY